MRAHAYQKETEAESQGSQGHLLAWRRSPGRAEIRGKDVKWSLCTADPAVAKVRRKIERDRIVAAAYCGESRRVFADVLEAWEPHIRQVSPTMAAR